MNEGLCAVFTGRTKGGDFVGYVPADSVSKDIYGIARCEMANAMMSGYIAGVNAAGTTKRQRIGFRVVNHAGEVVYRNTVFAQDPDDRRRAAR